MTVLTKSRILSIDAFRGITILTMIFVNELAGVSGMPDWMKHMPADADAMTFVDVVFPAFLFIVGMSIPFSIQKRQLNGDSFTKIQKHILFRTLGLLVLGVFMVNAEDGYHEENMVISIHVWSLLFYGAVILIWNDYPPNQNRIVYFLRTTGAITLIILAFLFRGGSTGTEYITPKWWGILGLIGWAYLVGCVLFQVFQGRKAAMILSIAICTAYYCLGHSSMVAGPGWLHSVFTQGGHAAHASIVLSGIVLSLIFFEGTKPKTRYRRFAEAAGFAMLLFSSGYFLRPFFRISKIYATPTWCLYSAAICIVLFGLLYWLIDIKQSSRWTTFLRPAASNALLTYLIPFVVYEALRVLNISLPGFLYQGIPGLFWAGVYAVLVLGIVKVLNGFKIKLQL